MRDIYLIDFENVASEGLSGITYLAPEDEVIIFYSNNSKSLSMKMHILIGKSVCKLDYFEATVGGKNALDHQISTWLGYLVGTNAAERNYYIVSRDMGYKFVASFWADTPMKPNVRCVESIRAAGRIERSRQLQREAAAKAAAAAVEQPPMLKSPEPVPMLHAAPVPEPVQEPAQVPVAEAPVQEAAEPLPEAAAAPEPVQTTPAPVPETTLPETAPPEMESTPAEAPADQPEPPQEELPESRRSRSRRARRSRSKSRSAESAQEPAESPAAPETAPAPKPEIQAEVKAEPKPEPKAASKRDNRRKKPEPQKEPVRVDLGSLIAPYPGLQEAHLQELISGNKRQVLCNTLRKQLGQEKGLALYNEIKKSAWR